MSHSKTSKIQMNQKTQTGGTVDAPRNQVNTDKKNDDALYLYKAKKYHYKCNRAIRDMMAGGKPCPAGFEKYLGPFTA